MDHGLKLPKVCSGLTFTGMKERRKMLGSKREGGDARECQIPLWSQLSLNIPAKKGK